MKGFTLIELVVTITIVVVLSVVSVPIYKDYVWKSKTTEAYTLLATIREAEKCYYSEYGYFPNFHHFNDDVYWRGTCYDPVLGIDARANKYYSWFRPYLTDCYNYFNVLLYVTDLPQVTYTYNLDGGETFSGL